MIKKLIILFLLFLPLTNLAYAQTNSATLSISPASPSVNINSEFNVQIILNTGGESVNAVDARLNFDTARLTVVSITPGSLFATYPLQTHSGNLITISGIDSTFNTPYSGNNGVFATIRFRAIQSGTPTPITFEYTNGSTTDSNIVSSTSANDILQSVTNANVTINNILVPSGRSIYIGIGIGTIALGFLAYNFELHKKLFFRKK
jgi:hypothetical protein